MQVTTIQFILGSALLACSVAVHATPIASSAFPEQSGSSVDNLNSDDTHSVAGTGFPSDFDTGANGGVVGPGMNDHPELNGAGTGMNDHPELNGGIDKIPLLEGPEVPDDVNKIVDRQGPFGLFDLFEGGEDAGGAEEGAADAAGSAKSGQGNKGAAKGDKKEAQTTVASQPPAPTSTGKVGVVIGGVDT